MGSIITINNSQEKVIIKGAPEAATYMENICGWVSSTGKYWGDNEECARLDGYTHYLCEKCGALLDRKKNVLTKCDACRELEVDEHYLTMAQGTWSKVDDQEPPLYSDSQEEYFFDEDELLQYCLDSEITNIKDMRLILCVPQYCEPIEPDEYYQDILPGDGDEHSLPQEILAAFAELNRKIRECKKAVSWLPDKVRLSDEWLACLQEDLHQAWQDAQDV